MSNIEQIEVLKSEIECDDKKLNEAYLNRASSEEHNKKIEDTLLDKFLHLFKTFEFFDGVNENNVEQKLSDAILQVEDSKKSLDIFTKSFNTLIGSGISLEEEQEYLSYVENAKCAYYSFKEQEYVFKIYKLLLSKYTDYNQILYKREEINDILYERLKLRKEHKVSGNDVFSSVYDILERQYDDIKRQSVDIENIEKLTSKINEKRSELNRLENENQKVEILSLLREFCIIDTYADVTSNNDNDVSVDVTDEFDDSSSDNLVEDNLEISIDNKVEDVKEDNNKEIFDTTIEVSDIISESIDSEEVLDNQVILVENANLVDLDLIHSKASKVMKRVGEMLGIKVENTEVVSVSNDENENIFMNDNENVDEFNIEEKAEDEVLENPLFSNNIEEESSEIEASADNPLFSNEIVRISDKTLENPLFTNDTVVKEAVADEFSFPDVDDSNDFWFSSDTPDALNELPDLNVSNDDFFANNNVADLEFPDLNMDFPDIDMEEKI